jgi:hypothetical protein
MFTRLLTRSPAVVVSWLLLAGGCVNLTPPWAGGTDAVAQAGGAIQDGTIGTTDSSFGGTFATGGSLAGGARGGDDALGVGGAAGGAQDDGALVTGAGGAGDTPVIGGTLGTGGTIATGAGGNTATAGTPATGGIPAAGGAKTGGAGGATATGGSSTAADAKFDQAQKNDTTTGPEVVPPADAGADAPDAPAGPDLATDPAVGVPTQGLVAYYPCEQATGTTLPDLSGKNHDGTLAGATGFAAGQVGNALVLTATNGIDGGTSSGGYATLAAGLLLGATEMTVSAWFKINSTVGYDNFQRVFDFGTSSSTSSMYFTPRNASGLPQFTIRFRPEAGAEIKQDLISTGSAIAANVWYHVAVLLDATGGHIYLNGVSVASSTTMTMRPADLGAMPNNWIGRSEFPNDPYFDGMIDEFRVYNRGLTSSEIATLFAAR